MTATKRALRIRVTHGDESKVNITVPLGLAKLARLGGVADKLSKEHGIDLDEIITSVEGSPDGKIIDVVDEKSGDHVEIFVETPGAVESKTAVSTV